MDTTPHKSASIIDALPIEKPGNHQIADSSNGEALEEAVSSSADRIMELFGSMGLRNTRPRRLIAEHLAAFEAHGSDFATEDLWKELQATEPQIGRATVYRAVDLLVRQGVLDRVPFSDGTHRYRLCGVSHHHHLTCNQCQRVVEIEACLSAELLSSIASKTDFAIEGHALELFGRCADCREDRVLSSDR